MTPADRPPPEITFGDLVRSGWKKLKEMRTVFQLLVVIAAAALISAVLPQNEDPQMYYQRYGRFLANIIVRLGLDHVHSTTWFLLLLGLLLLSLAACSGRLWREAALRWRPPTGEAADKRLSAAALKAISPTAPEDSATAATAALKKHGYRVQPVPSQGNKRVLYAQKHRLSAWGQALAHYSVFLIALGSVMGGIHGLSLDQNITIMEGDTFRSEDGSIPFGIKVNGFKIVQDPANGAVKNYYSDVALVDGDKEVLRGELSVNHPLRYRGYFISQSDWGLGEAKLEITRGGKTEQYTFPLQRGACPEMGGDQMSQSTWGVPQENAALFLPGGDAALVATSFFADARRENGKVVQGDPEYPGTPAINLTYVSGIPGHKPQGPAAGAPKHGMKELGWLLPGETAKIDGGVVKFVGISKSTGLGVRKDFGLPLVWLGFIASMIGLVMIFYFPLQRSILAFEAAGGGKSTITMSRYSRRGDLADDGDELWRDVVAQTGAKAASAPAGRTKQKENHSD
jgi:cytochrome c biogenesis protein ResB